MKEKKKYFVLFYLWLRKMKVFWALVLFPTALRTRNYLHKHWAQKEINFSEVKFRFFFVWKWNYPLSVPMLLLSHTFGYLAGNNLVHSQLSQGDLPEVYLFIFCFSFGNSDHETLTGKVILFLIYWALWSLSLSLL